MAADVKCVVTNCKYHTMNNCCEAGSIEVTPCSDNCCSSNETACKTFAPKN
ncbi:MAG: DUF1540 domain-containing protein [Clostridia bacterium]|nr:DUF1540 domain-containing protein [Clostridia bacterium]